MKVKHNIALGELPSSICFYMEADYYDNLSETWLEGVEQIIMLNFD